jgi:hypothetical protein
MVVRGSRGIQQEGVGQQGAYPGVDGLEAILTNIRISCCSSMHRGCRYLEFCAKLGRNVDFHACVEVMGRVLVSWGSAPQT